MNSILLTFMLSLIPTISQASVQVKENTKSPILHLCKKSDSPVNILACNMYREARGESDRGMLAVGFVTLNRKDHDNFPESIRKIVYQKGQFSWTNYGTSFYVHDREAWDRAKGYATMLLALHKGNKKFYETVDFTRGSTYFVTKRSKPLWSKSFRHIVTIGNHKFYKDERDG